MAIQVTCPTCARQLPIPNVMLGKTVKCITCGQQFNADAQHTSAATEPPTAPPEPLSAAKAALAETVDAPPPDPPAPPPEKTDGLLAAEVQPVLKVTIDPDPDPDEPVVFTEIPPTPNPTTDASCRFCGERLPRESVYCPYCGEHQGGVSPIDDDDFGPSDWMRRDCEPHRGSLILTLGTIGMIGSFASVILCMFAPIVQIAGLACSITAMVMAKNDLAKMQDGVMDPQGHKQTKSGHTYAIIGTVLNAVFLLSCGGFWGYAWRGRFPF